MPNMRKALLFAAALGLAACATSTSEFILAADLSCSAQEALRCPARGCEAGPGQSELVPISLTVPRMGGWGRFCMATGCENALFEPRPSRALGLTATMRTNERSNLNAELEIASDQRGFVLRDADSEGVSTWVGACSPAGS